MIHALVALGAIMFSSKGIMVKLLYAEGLSPTGVLAVRMGVALPFYIIPLFYYVKSLRSVATGRDWAAMAGLSFIGYFLCSLVNFTGLQYISVGLERIILFCYPSLVLLGSAVFQKQRPSMSLILASSLTWGGLYLVIKKEIHLGEDPQWVLIGSGFVLLSAIIYAGYILIAKPVIMRVGSHLYTSITMCFSCVFVLVNFAVSDGNTSQFVATREVIIYGLLIGILGTVVPTYLLSYGLSKLKPASHAVISSIGPVATIAISLIMIGVPPSFTQLVGIALSITGSLLASRR